MNTLKFQVIDDLWMDAEGAEYGMFEFFYNGGEFDKNNIKFCQINIEVCDLNGN